MTASKTVIGIDPDCKKSGFAIFVDGNLKDLKKLNFSQVMLEASSGSFKDAIFIVEDANQIKTIYKKNRNLDPVIQSSIAQKVGKNKQIATCLIDLLRFYNFKVKEVKPMSGNWAKAKMKKQFEACTGWKKRSCEETRSAAYFGYMFLNNCDDAK